MAKPEMFKPAPNPFYNLVCCDGCGRDTRHRNKLCYRCESREDYNPYYENSLAGKCAAIKKKALETRARNRKKKQEKDNG